jgi:hypothetical protein
VFEISVQGPQSVAAICATRQLLERLSAPPARAILILSPEWRNWQTQQTQNLPELCSVWVRLPPPGLSSLKNPLTMRGAA